MGKQGLPALVMELLAHEIENDEDTGKGSLALNVAMALATCLTNCTITPLTTPVR